MVTHNEQPRDRTPRRSFHPRKLEAAPGCAKATLLRSVSEANSPPSAPFRPPRCGRPAAPPRRCPPRALLLCRPLLPRRSRNSRSVARPGLGSAAKMESGSRTEQRGLPGLPLAVHTVPSAGTRRGSRPARTLFLPRHLCLPRHGSPSAFRCVVVCALRPLSGRPLPEPWSRPDSAFTACEGLFRSGLSSWGSQEFLGA